MKQLRNYFQLFLKEDEDFSTLGFTPYYFQKDAVDLWLEKEKGIFKFATGAGKTKAAIFLMERLKSVYKKMFYIIVVPNKTLVNQWTEELNAYNFNTLKCYSDNKEWNKRLKDKIDIFPLYETRYEYVIVTNDSFFNEKFQRELPKLEDTFMLIVDECHTWGDR